MEEHQATGTPRHLWEGTAIHNDHFTAADIESGEHKLADRLKAEVDPALDDAQDLIADVEVDLDQVAQDSLPITTPESGTNHSIADTVRLVERHDAKIEHDASAGKHHHRRASTVLKRVGRVAPWVEAVGFLAFLAYYLNVPLLRPWEDWLGWTFAMAVVVFIILGQTWLVRHGADSHNHAREAAAEGNRHEAERAVSRRNCYLIQAAIAAVAITSGMVARGVIALGNASHSTTVVMAFLAAVTGLLMPIMAYLGVALDGSKVSRERDAIAAALDEDVDDFLETTKTARRSLAGVADIRDTLNGKTFPGICNNVQEIVDASYYLYNAARMLIGGLTAKPPVKTTKTVERNSSGRITGRIGTGIPGSRSVDLAPLLDRCGRLADLEQQRRELLTRLDALPAHPWTTPGLS